MKYVPEPVIVEKGVPIPSPDSQMMGRRKWVNLIEGMEVGDSFKVKATTGRVLADKLKKQGSKATIVVSRVGCPEGYVRVWRSA